MVNHQVWCDFVASVYSRITNIYNELLEHENLSQECEMCKRDAGGQLLFLKNQITIVARVKNLGLLVKVIKQGEEVAVKENLPVSSEGENTEDRCIKESCVIENNEPTQCTDYWTTTELHSADEDELPDLWDNYQCPIEPTQTVECPKSDEIFSCALCDYKVGRKHNLSRHINRHHRKHKPPKPMISKDEFGNLYPMYKKLGQQRCKLCGARYKTIHHCSKLGETIHRKFTCEYCPESFTVYQKIYRHYKVKHPDKPKPLSPYQCEICGAFAITLAQLRQHMMFHTDNYPFTCDLCEKKFRTKQKMKEHRQTHLPKHKRDNKHNCKICGKRFHSSTSLKGHTTMAHREKKIFKCNICGKEFLRDLSLKKHLINDDHSVTVHTCDLCDKKFSSKQKLKEHRLTHPPEDNKGDLLCALCGRRCAQKCNLASHMRWRHSSVIRKKNKEENLEEYIPKWKKLGKSKCKLCKGIYMQNHVCRKLEGPD